MDIIQPPTANTLIDAGGTLLQPEVIQIGDWNMDADMTKTVAHGLADHTKVRMINVLIRDDTGVVWPMFQQLDDDTGPGTPQGYIYCDGTNVVMSRGSGTFWDQVLFDSTSYNRGWILFWSVP